MTTDTICLEGRSIRDVCTELDTHLEAEGLIDEYFGVNNFGYPINSEFPGHVWIACFAVTGGSEGHYIHVDVYPKRYQDGRAAEAPIHIALGKTFQGMEHAYKIAQRCAELLGA